MSQTNHGLWPREDPRQTKSEAERRVYDALKTSLPKGWYAWHSLKLRTEMKGEFSEADFIITDPNRPSVLILEIFRLKGLERPAVIVTDLRLVSDLYETRMHIAVYRATSLLRVVGLEKEIKKGPRLAELI